MNALLRGSNFQQYLESNFFSTHRLSSSNGISIILKKIYISEDNEKNIMRNVIMESAVNLDQEHIPTPQDFASEEREVCRICLCQSPSVMYPCKCRGSLGIHHHCFQEFMQHQLAHKNGITPVDDHWVYSCQLCHSPIMFECERTVNWTWKLKLCVGTQVLGIVLMLAFITTIIVLILTRLPEDGGIILVTVLVVFVLVGCLVGVIITVIGSIKRAVNESSSIVSLNLIT